MFIKSCLPLAVFKINTTVSPLPFSSVMYTIIQGTRMSTHNEIVYNILVMKFRGSVGTLVK